MSYAIKDVIIDDWIATQKQFDETGAKKVYYLSMEFLMGRALGNNIINLGAKKAVKEALEELGFDSMRLRIRSDPALETAVVGASGQHVFWIPWQRLVIRLTAAASVTIMVCSSRKLKTATRWRCRMSG